MCRICCTNRETAKILILLGPVPHQSAKLENLQRPKIASGVKKNNFKNKSMQLITGPTSCYKISHYTGTRTSSCSNEMSNDQNKSEYHAVNIPNTGPAAAFAMHRSLRKGLFVTRLHVCPAEGGPCDPAEQAWGGETSSDLLFLEADGELEGSSGPVMVSNTQRLCPSALCLDAGRA